MADNLVQIFKVVEKKAGLNGRIILVEKTGISLSQAEEMPDQPEILAKVKTAASEILGQPIDKLLGK